MNYASKVLGERGPAETQMYGRETEASVETVMQHSVHSARGGLGAEGASSP